MVEINDLNVVRIVNITGMVAEKISLFIVEGKVENPIAMVKVVNISVED